MTLSNDISATLNLIAKQGDTFERNFSVEHPNGTPYNFTGYSLQMQIKSTKQNTISALELNSGDEITLSTGQIKILIPSAKMKEIPARGYFYDLQITYPNGVVKTWLSGQFNINQDVTR